jgi:acyl carrier protein
MEIKEFMEKFAEQFDETPAEQFATDTKFRDLEEWSSLMALNVILMVDEEYDITLKGDDILKVQTIEELFNLVKSKA